MPSPMLRRTNYHPDPRGTAIGALWGYQLGTGETAASSLMTANSPKRTNLARNPRGTDAARWFGSFGTGGAATETMVSGASDGPLLPDGTRPTTYARYTFTTANTGGNSIFGYNTANPASDAYPQGTPAALAIYVRSSRATGNTVRLYGRGLTAAGGQTDPSYSPEFSAAAAGEWIRVSMIHVPTVAVGDWLPYAHFSGVFFQVGDTVDVVCAMVEPGAFEVGPYFDGDTPNTEDATYAWTGAANASTSTATFNDGPLLPDGSRIDTYVRRTITAAKTAGSSGPWCRVPTGTFGLVAGDQVSPTMHVRFSVAVTITVQSTARNGSAGAGAVNVANVAVPANTWTRVGDMATATGAADNTQVWAVLAAGTILPVGTTVDTTGGQSELGAITPYLDGSFAPVPQPDGTTLVYAWTGAANTSASTETVVPAPLTVTPDPANGRVRLEVYGGPPDTALYIFRRSTTGGGVDIVRDTSEGTAGFPELDVKRRNLITNPRLLGTTEGWAVSGGTIAPEGAQGAVASVTGSTSAGATVRPVNPATGGGWPVAVGDTVRFMADLENVFTGAASIVTRLYGFDAAGTIVQTIATDTWTAAAGATRSVDLRGAVTAPAVVTVQPRITVTLSGPRNVVQAGTFESVDDVPKIAKSPTLETDITSAWATDGVMSLLVKVVTAATTAAAYQDCRGPIPAAGRFVGMGVDVRLSSGTVWVRPAIIFRAADNAIIGGVQVGAAVQASSSTTTRLSYTAAVPAGAVYWQTYVYMYGSSAGAAAAAGAAIMLDSWTAVADYATAADAAADAAAWRPLLEGRALGINRGLLDAAPTSAALDGPWFDGDSTSSNPAQGYAWLGEPGLSASIFGDYVPAQLYDYEVAQGDTVDYILTDDDGNQIATQRVTVPLWGTWLKSPGRPTRNLRCAFGKLEKVTQPIAREAYDVEGSGQVVVYAARRSDRRGDTVVLITRTDTEADRMRLLLSDGATLMLDTDPRWNLGLRYVSIGDVSETRPLAAADGFQNLDASARSWELNEVIAQAAPQGASVGEPGRTYTVLPTDYASYVAIPATTATYETLATGGGA